MANAEGHFMAYRNYIEDVSTTIATSAEAQGDRIASNLKTTESDDAWRFAVAEDATSATVTATFSSAQTVGVVTAFFPRGAYPGVTEASPVFAATDTIRYRLLSAADEELANSGAEPSGVAPGYMTHYWRPDQPVTGVTKVEATFNAASRVAAGFCDVGNLGAWPIIEPAVGFAYPAGFSWRHNTENQRTPAGRLYTARFEPLRRWNLQLDFLSRDESLAIDEMLRYSGGARQAFVRRGDFPFGKDAMLGVVSAPRDTEWRTGTILQQSLTFDEFI